MSYPVEWNKKRILRDFVQNFYDDAGYSEFGKIFKSHYNPKASKLTLSTKSEGFNYEWLMHMGASTKQESAGKYAGFFGEGFKVASLCALRDHHWKIHMRSKNWSLEVVSIVTNIDGKDLHQLAYQVEDNLDITQDTLLTIGEIDEKDAKLIDGVVYGFYYQENPLIGKCIFKNDMVSIHERSTTPKPDHFPSGLAVSGDGIVFIGFQARSSFVQPLVLCNHSFQTSDRERHDVYFGTLLDVLLNMIDSLDATTCCYMLEQLKKYWYDYPDSRKDVDSWYSVIRKLIRKIVYTDSSSTIRDKFIQKYPHLVACERPTNTEMRNKKTQALSWKKLHSPMSKLVQDSFVKLGYKTIVQLCEEAGGFNQSRVASTTQERQLLLLLKQVAKEIFGDFFVDYPLCKVIENDSASCRGMAKLQKRIIQTYNSMGHQFRYHLIQIEIKKSLLEKERFSEAFSVYCHELCHCFGADASASFSRSLTDAMSLIMTHMECLQDYRQKWLACF